MVVLAKAAVKEAAIRYSGCAKALNEWYDVTRAASWKDFLAVKQTYRNTDYVAPDRLVFDVCGNRLRVVTMVHFSTRTLDMLQRCIRCLGSLVLSQKPSGGWKRTATSVASESSLVYSINTL